MTRLKLVPPTPEEVDPEAMLATLVPELIRAEQKKAALHELVSIWRRKLAAARGVSFIREEAVRREFSGR